MLFKFRKIDPVTKEIRFSVGILLENGDIHLLETEDTADSSSWKLKRELPNYVPMSIPGDVFSCYDDPDKYIYNFFLTLKDKKDTLQSQSDLLLIEH